MWGEGCEFEKLGRWVVQPKGEGGRCAGVVGKVERVEEAAEFRKGMVTQMRTSKVIPFDL